MLNFLRVNKKTFFSALKNDMDALPNRSFQRSAREIWEISLRIWCARACFRRALNFSEIPAENQQNFDFKIDFLYFFGESCWQLKQTWPSELEYPKTSRTFILAIFPHSLQASRFQNTTWQLSECPELHRLFTVPRPTLERLGSN